MGVVLALCRERGVQRLSSLEAAAWAGRAGRGRQRRSFGAKRSVASWRRSDLGAARCSLRVGGKAWIVSEIYELAVLPRVDELST